MTGSPPTGESTGVAHGEPTRIAAGVEMLSSLVAGQVQIRVN